MKKNFSTTENPALQFISKPEAATQEAPEAPEAAAPEAKQPEKTTPAAADQGKDQAKTAAPEKKPERKKAPAKNKCGRPKKEGELKDRRYNLNIKKSTADSLQKIAYVKRVSMNELFNQIAEEYISAHGKELDFYNSFFNGQ